MAVAYTPNFTGDDFGSIVIDVLGRIGYAILPLGTIIGLILIYRWYKGRK